MCSAVYSPESRPEEDVCSEQHSLAYASTKVKASSDDECRGRTGKSILARDLQVKEEFSRWSWKARSQTKNGPLWWQQQKKGSRSKPRNAESHSSHSAGALLGRSQRMLCVLGCLLFPEEVAFSHGVLYRHQRFFFSISENGVRNHCIFFSVSPLLQAYCIWETRPSAHKAGTTMWLFKYWVNVANRHDGDFTVGTSSRKCQPPLSLYHQGVCGSSPLLSRMAWAHKSIPKMEGIWNSFFHGHIYLNSPPIFHDNIISFTKFWHLMYQEIFPSLRKWLSTAVFTRQQLRKFKIYESKLKKWWAMKSAVWCLLGWNPETGLVAKPGIIHFLFTDYKKKKITTNATSPHLSSWVL